MTWGECPCIIAYRPRSTEYSYLFRWFPSYPSYCPIRVNYWRRVCSSVPQSSACESNANIQVCRLHASPQTTLHHPSDPPTNIKNSAKPPCLLIRELTLNRTTRTAYHHGRMVRRRRIVLLTNLLPDSLTAAWTEWWLELVCMHGMGWT